MGLLEDAIKEHLDLKRQRGVDSAEVENQEQEALGPMSQGDAVPLAEPAENEFAEPAELGEPEAGEFYAEEPAEAVHDELPAEEPAFYEEPIEPAAPTAEPAQEPDPAAPIADPNATQPHTTIDPESDDVLEETPEFLQETPEHDRLWFEQRPPRDFDFDG